LNEESKVCDAINEHGCNNRREFLTKASFIAGGVILGLSNLKSVNAQKDNKSTGEASDEIVLKLDDKSPLSKVGGFDTIETKTGKVVVVRMSEISFKAYSAICPHKGGPIYYDEKTQQLYCPSHNSRFDTKGQVVKGPAKAPLKVFGAQNAVVVGLEVKE
jgi:cytochrome b6-f complex iron-sulfur subunit